MRTVTSIFTIILMLTIGCGAQTVGTRWCYVMKVREGRLESQPEIKELHLKADNSYKWGSTRGTYKLEGNRLTLTHDQGVVDNYIINSVDKSCLKLIPNAIDKVVLYFIAYP